MERSRSTIRDTPSILLRAPRFRRTLSPVYPAVVSTTAKITKLSKYGYYNDLETLVKIDLDDAKPWCIGTCVEHQEYCKNVGELPILRDPKILANSSGTQP